MMAESQPLSAAPEGAEYLRAVLRAPVYEAAQVTPLQKMEKISSRLDNVILVKREDRQPVHSFKLRGAYAMMAGLTEEQKARGVITASAGNHAQGVAFSAARLGLKALIVMPVATADIKVDAVRGFGGEVLLHGANFDEAKAKAIELVFAQSRPTVQASVIFAAVSRADRPRPIFPAVSISFTYFASFSM
jgi:threonine dehydratase